MAVAAVRGQTESQLQPLPSTADRRIAAYTRKNPSPFFPLPTLQKKAEMWDIL